MGLLAIVVFFSLKNIKAGYGRFYNETWGPTINNRLGWFLMEAPVFFFMMTLWLMSDRVSSWPHIVIFLFFQLHYFQRSFIFPLLLRGKGIMPISIIGMGVLFNMFNALMQGGWLFFVSPDYYYTSEWFTTPQFIIGSIVFFIGMWVNLSSDHIIRQLRKHNDNKHYMPQKGMFKYVTSANYTGECLEWIGYAILTWSLAALVFTLWVISTLLPRAASLYEYYKLEYPATFEKHKNLKRIIPFIY